MTNGGEDEARRMALVKKESVKDEGKRAGGGKLVWVREKEREKGADKETGERKVKNK